MILMKLTRGLFFAISIVALLSCEKADELTTFNMDFENEVEIPPTTGINLPIDLFTPDITTNSESTFESNNTAKNLIEEIKLSKLTLTLTSPQNADFSFLESVEVYIKADGLNEVKIAESTNVPQSASSFDLEVTGVDVQEYIKKDEYDLRVKVVTDELISSTHKIRVNSVFRVNARILGI